MFKGYLRHHPVMFQLSVFAGLWSLLQLIVLTFFSSTFNQLYGADAYTAVLSGTSSETAVNGFIIINLLSRVLVYALPVAIFAYLSSPQPLKYLELKSFGFKKGFLAVILGLVLMVALPVMSSLMSTIDMGETAAALQEKRKLTEAIYFKDDTIWTLLRNVFLMAVVPAVTEELFFRGGIQRFANSWLKKPWLSILLTAVFFALVHDSISNFVIYVFAGVVLGWIFHLSGNLWIAILAHFICNGVQVYIECLGVDVHLETKDQVIVVLVALVMLGILLYMLKKISGSLPKNWSVFERKPEELTD